MSDTDLTTTRPPVSPPAVRPAFEGFEGAATAPFPDEARKVLAAAVDPRDVEIRTDGIVYLSGVWYRRQLIRAFGAGGWAIVPRTPPQKTGEMITYHGALIVLGRFVAEATGECETRGGMSYASALEGARTDCITRCCKDLGMGSELWDPSWRKAWTRDCAYTDGVDSKGKPKWYKNDGSERDMDPLFKQEMAAQDAAYRATVAESAGPKAPAAAASASHATSTPTTTPARSAAPPTPATAATTLTSTTSGTTTAPAKDFLTAPKVPVAEGDKLSVAGQWTRLNILRTELGWDDWEGGKQPDPLPDIGKWPKYRESIGRYRTWKGVRCVSAKELTVDQASNLIKRMEAQKARNEAAKAGMDNEAVGLLQEHLARRGPQTEDWRHFDSTDLGLVDSTFTPPSSVAGPSPAVPPHADGGGTSRTGVAAEWLANTDDGPRQGPKPPPPSGITIDHGEAPSTDAYEATAALYRKAKFKNGGGEAWLLALWGVDAVGALTAMQTEACWTLLSAWGNRPLYEKVLVQYRSEGRVRVTP